MGQLRSLLSHIDSKLLRLAYPGHENCDEKAGMTLHCWDLALCDMQ